VKIGDMIEHRYRQSKIGVIIKLKPVDAGKNGKHNIWDTFIEWADGTNGWVALTHVKPYSNE
jgi:phosphoribosyl 1,2-cyclic phosphodiesterase